MKWYYYLLISLAVVIFALGIAYLVIAIDNSCSITSTEQLLCNMFIN